jgi:hypothetical protein
VPKASLTYTSPNFFNDSLNFFTSSLSAFTFSPAAFTPFPSSSMWNRRFSKRNIVPGAGSAQAFSTSGPTQSGKNVTSLKYFKLSVIYEQLLSSWTFTYLLFLFLLFH